MERKKRHVQSQKFIIGGGIAGLIYGFYNRDYQVISPDIGGKLKTNYLTSTKTFLILGLANTQMNHTCMNLLEIYQEKKLQSYFLN